jgi:hypothetical protein
MSDISQTRSALFARILEGSGRASHAQRRAAFENALVAESTRKLIDKVARHAYKIMDEDVAAALASGLGEDQVFEMVVCAAVGQASRQYETALAALESVPEGTE